MFILLKLHYAKFDVPRLFCSKVFEEKPLGSTRPPPPLDKERVNFGTSTCQTMQIDFDSIILSFMLHDVLFFGYHLQFVTHLLCI